MVSANTTPANEPADGLILVYTVKLKPMIKTQISGRMVSSGISDRLKKLMMMMKMIIIILNKSQETTVFRGRQKLISVMKLRPEK